MFGCDLPVGEENPTKKRQRVVPVTKEQFELDLNGRQAMIGHGSVVIAAITSCTNTSNPSVIIGAGLMARNAVRKGLKIPTHVKTSLAPGSKVVNDYLQAAGFACTVFDVAGPVGVLEVSF